MSFRSPSRHLRAYVRLALLVLALGGVATAAASPSASAASSSKPCWKKVLNDWFVDGRIDGTYPPKCLNAAMAHLGPDAQEYSSFSDEAHRALAADARWRRQHPKLTPHYNENPNGGKSGGRYGPAPPNHPGGPGGTATSAGPIPSIIDQGSPASATSIPVPLLVLGGLALVLLLAGVASYLARRLRGGPPRPPLAPATGPRGPQQP